MKPAGAPGSIRIESDRRQDLSPYNFTTKSASDRACVGDHNHSSWYRACLDVAEGGGAGSCRAPPFDVDEPCELAERLSAVAAEPAVAIAENYKRALTAALALDPRPWQGQNPIACGGAVV
jgi:hypothetical protein